MLTIQLGHPKIQQVSFPVVEKLQEAFLDLFRSDEESIWLFWNDVPLELRYKEDLSRSFDNILAMVWLVQRDERGAIRVELENPLLSIQWEVRWEQDEIAVLGRFSAKDKLHAPYAEALNKSSEVRSAKGEFLSEWKTLLHQVIVAFQAGRVEIQDGPERRKWELLQRVEQEIPKYGKLYLKPL
jgi:hypothetical protein